LVSLHKIGFVLQNCKIGAQSGVEFIDENGSCMGVRFRDVSESEDESEEMASTTFTLRVETDVKKRLEKLAKSTGRSRSFLAAEALSEYLDVNEWQVAGVSKAMGSLDRGEGVPNEKVKAWVNSWGGKRERPAPKRSAK
jgi:RHH-type transcriptional regulator, rel operon repressor / antitoxin RelB